MIKTGDNYKFFTQDLEKLAKVMFAVAIGNYALSVTMQGLRNIQMPMMICKECKEKRHISTQNFGGKFICKNCKKLVTGVPSIGHGVICSDCQKQGYCKYCGKCIIEII